jgi:hypothetical protein
MELPVDQPKQDDVGFPDLFRALRPLEKQSPMFPVYGLRYKLVPVRQGLYDTEYYPAGGGVTDLILFQRQLGAPFAYAPENSPHKGVESTNVQQPGQLCLPQVFQMFGLNLNIDLSASERDKAALLNTGCLMFLRGGNRVYLIAPLWQIPSRQIPQQKYSRLLDEALCVRDFSNVPYDVPSEKLELNVGDSYLTIQPGESFQVKLSWPEPVRTEQPLRISVALDGLLYLPV